MWLDNIWVGETMKFRLLILSPLLFLCSNCVLSSGFRIGYSLCIHPFDPLFIIYKMWFMAVSCMFWLFHCYNFLHSGHCHIFSNWTRKNNGYLSVMYRTIVLFKCENHGESRIAFITSLILLPVNILNCTNLFSLQKEILSGYSWIHNAFKVAKINSLWSQQFLLANIAYYIRKLPLFAYSVVLLYYSMIL